MTVRYTENVVASFIHLLIIEHLRFARPSRQAGDLNSIRPECLDGKWGTWKTVRMVASQGGEERGKVATGRPLLILAKLCMAREHSHWRGRRKK